MRTLSEPSEESPYRSHSKQLRSLDITTNDSELTSEAQPRVGTASKRRRYGNLIVLFQNERYLITLGPDYICFGLAMTAFIVLYYFTVMTVYRQPGKEVFAFVMLVLALIQVLSYVMVAISNPGIITRADFDTQGEQEASKVKRFCKMCELPMLPRSRHCSQCNVCIKGYDHHCPWTSKCIGQHNLYRFYFFAGYTPLFIIACIIVLSMSA